MNLKHFKPYQKQQIQNLTKQRKFETKMGEVIQTLSNGTALPEALEQLSARFIIIGIPEDIGVLANEGKPGTSSCWDQFLQYFLNIQSNDFLEGDDVAVLGSFDFSDLQQLIDKNAHDTAEKLEAYRHAVNTIDEEVELLVKAIVAHDKIPVVIGGGHNNAYPIIKGTAKGLNKLQYIPIAQINCINLDAHSDYRPTEGRHSGNAFRYAEEDGFLQKYCALGIHENYLPQNVWIDLVNNPFMDCITYEDIFIHEKRTFRQAVSHAIEYTNDNFTGIELDLDSVENVLSSAATPCGISPLHARQYINLCAVNAKACYLHICEGASKINERTQDGTGKLVSYLVSDFIKMLG
jgi:formiminoglutamase